MQARGASAAAIWLGGLALWLEQAREPATARAGQGTERCVQSSLGDQALTNSICINALYYVGNINHAVHKGPYNEIEPIPIKSVNITYEIAHS